MRITTFIPSFSVTPITFGFFILTVLIIMILIILYNERSLRKKPLSF